MAKAVVNIESDGTKALRDVKALATEFGGLKKAVTDVAEQSKKSNDEASKGIEIAISTVGKMVTAIGGVTVAWRLATAEVEKYHQKNRDASQANRPFSASVSAAVRNAPEGISRADIERMVENASAKTGISPQQMANAVPGVFAAGGAMGVDDAATRKARYQEVLEATGPLAADSPEDFSAMTANAATLMQNNPGWTAKRALGVLSMSSAGSQVDKQRDYAPLLNRIAGAAENNNLQQEDLIALFNATTRGTSDPNGDRSGTAVGALAVQLRKYRDATPELSGVSDIPAILAHINADPKRAAKFRGGVTGESLPKSFIEGLFNPGSRADRLSKEAFASLSSFNSADAAYDQLAKELGSTSLAKTAQHGRAIEAGAERMTLDEGRVAAGTSREAYGKLRAQMDTYAIADNLKLAEFDAVVAMGADPAEYSTKQIRQASNYYLSDKKTKSGDPRIGTPDQYRPASESEVNMGQKLDRIADLLESQLGVAKEQARPQPIPNGPQPLSGGNIITSGGSATRDPRPGAN